MSKLRAAFFSAPFLVVSLVACSSEISEPDDSEPSIESTTQAKGTDPCATVRCAAGTHCVAKGRRASCVADSPSCQQDSDCRLFDNYCGGCACDALPTTSPDPVCGGGTVQCFVQPCRGLTARCSGGTCTASAY